MSTPVHTPLILVVDDDAATCALTATLLERDGHRTLRTTSGKEGLAIIAREPVTLLLLDVVMPEMGGFEVCAALRATDVGRKLPIILLTGKDDIDTRQEGMRLGVSEFLTKPIDRHELSARVRAQLHIVELTRQLETVERNLKSATHDRSESDDR
ncbi:MAG: response regulator [bacterium]|nr:response regulator [bacterium]